MFTIKQNDTFPALEAKLFDADDKPINLELCGVKFHMNERGGKNLINEQAVIVDINEGIVKYDWKEGDTSRVGVFNCEFEVNMPNGKVITVPNEGYFNITIIKELA